MLTNVKVGNGFSNRSRVLRKPDESRAAIRRD
jgi:hypothetical protein